MAKSTQTAFVNYNSTLTSRIEERIKEEKAIKSAINRAYVLDTGIKYSKEAKKMQIEKDLSQGYKLGRDFEEAKSLDSKSDLDLLRKNFSSQRLSEGKAYYLAVEDTSSPTETPDVGETAESQAEPQQQVVSVPQSEEDFVALMIERGLDLDKVVEIIFDLDNVKKVA